MSTAELRLLVTARDQAAGVLGNIAKLALGVGTAALAGAGLAAKAAADEEQGVVRLRQALSLVTDSVEDYASEWETAIHEMEKTTAFSDGEMRDALSLMIGMTGDADEAWRRLPAAMDLARGTGMDLAQTSKLLGKLTDENVNVLKKYGITVEKGADATDVLAQVQAKFGGQAAAFGQTAAGKMQNFKNQVDNLVEDVGGVLLPIFSKGIDIATDFIEALRGGGALEGVASTLSTIVTIIGEMLGVITGSAPDAGAKLSEVIGPEKASLIMQYLALIRDTFTAVFAVIGGILTGFTTGDWSAAQTAIADGSTAITDRVQTILTKVGEVVGALLSKLIEALPGIRDALLKWAGEFIKWIMAAIPPMLNEAMRLVGVLVAWLGDHAEDIGKTLVEWGLKFGEFIFTVAIPAILEHLPGIVASIAKWVAFDAIPGVLRIMANLGRGIVEGIWSGIQALAGWFLDRVREFIVSNIPEVVRKLLGISSPSKVMAELGREIPRGLAAGIDAESQSVAYAVDGMTAKVITAIDSMREKAMSAVRLAAGAVGVTGGAFQTMTGTHALLAAQAAAYGPGAQARVSLQQALAGPKAIIAGAGGVPIPVFANGGVMPWTGLAHLEAGERVSRAGEGGGVTVVFNGPVYGMSDFRRTVSEAVRDVARGGGFRGVLST